MKDLNKLQINIINLITTEKLTLNESAAILTSVFTNLIKQGHHRELWKDINIDIDNLGIDMTMTLLKIFTEQWENEQIQK